MWKVRLLKAASPWLSSLPHLLLLPLAEAAFSQILRDISVNEAEWVLGNCGNMERVCPGPALRTDLLIFQEKLEIQIFLYKI